MSENLEGNARKFKFREVYILVLALIIVGAFLAIKGNSGNNYDPVRAEQQRIAASNDLTSKYTVQPEWFPKGFSEFEEDIAWRWGTSKETNCTYSSGSCWSVVVIARYGCPRSMYAELAIYDSSDIQIDYTNDTTTNVLAMDKVKLTFDTFNEEASTARLAELNCY